jgi:glycosyltransferase involved in cell wall biosynthesis
MNGELEASVLIPTTGDRGDLLRCSVATVLRQTENRLEVLVVGDGMSSNSRGVIEEMAFSDHRIRIFDFPKHENRGEPNRHHILLHEARGRNIFYLCDRNLLLPDHVERLGSLLKDADLAHGLILGIRPDGQAVIEVGDLARASHRSLTVKGFGFVPLSTWGHTLGFYRKLPRGWERPSAGWASDQYMLAQFLAHPACKVATTMVPTVLQFQKWWHGKTGWTLLRELQDAMPLWRRELPVWLEKFKEADFSEKFREHAMEKAIFEQQTQIDFFHRHPIRYVLDKLKAKLESQVKARLKPRYVLDKLKAKLESQVKARLKPRN